MPRNGRRVPSFINVLGVVRLEVRVQHREVDRQPHTDLHAPACPLRRLRMQPVIDVHGAQPQIGRSLPRPRERMEYRQRVAPPLKATTKRVAGGNAAANPVMAPVRTARDRGIPCRHRGPRSVRIPAHPVHSSTREAMNTCRRMSRSTVTVP